MRFIKYLLGDYLKYDSINNLPISLWDKIHETNDVTLLWNKTKKKYNLKKLLKAWEIIVDEYLEEFGISKESQEEFEAKKKAAIFKAKYIITGKRHFLTHAEIELEKINFNKSFIDVKLEENLALLSKYYGFKIDGMNTTVSEYMSMQKVAINGNRNSKK